MLCYDAEHLYFAASFPRAKGVRTDGPIQRERRYDEDLADFDRVNLSVDIDRDYVTSFNFAVDQRGCTSEACWNDSSWNPRWLVAVDADKTSWRVEVAIPLDELTPVAPQRGTAWGLESRGLFRRRRRKLDPSRVRHAAPRKFRPLAI